MVLGDVGWCWVVLGGDAVVGTVSSTTPTASRHANGDGKNDGNDGIVLHHVNVSAPQLPTRVRCGVVHALAPMRVGC